MAAIFLRRRKLGRGSCHGIRRILQPQHNIEVARNDIRDRRHQRNPNHPRGYSPKQWLVRWGCTAQLPEGRYDNIIQPSRAIQQVNNKIEFRRLLLEEGNELVPRTWFDQNDETITYPCIVRPGHHAQGRALWVCNNARQLADAVSRARNSRWGPAYYISEVINKVAEYRVFIVQGRVAAVAQKTPGNPNDVAWNVAQGGRFDHVRWDDWPLQAVRKSVEAFNLTELDFGGVDVMVDGGGRAYIIEINSAPSLPLKSDGTPTHRQECMAKCFGYIFDTGSKQRIPIIEERGGYLKFIHPAICDRAILI